MLEVYAAPYCDDLKISNCLHIYCNYCEEMVLHSSDSISYSDIEIKANKHIAEH